MGSIVAKEVNDMKEEKRRGQSDASLCCRADYWFDLGAGQAQQGDHNGAVESFSQALEFSPRRWQCYYNRGNSFYELQQSSAALADYNKAIELEPTVAAIYYNRGNVLYYLS